MNNPQFDVNISGADVECEEVFEEQPDAHLEAAYEERSEPYLGEVETVVDFD